MSDEDPTAPETLSYATPERRRLGFWRPMLMLAISLSVTVVGFVLFLELPGQGSTPEMIAIENRNHAIRTWVHGISMPAALIAIVWLCVVAVSRLIDRQREWLRKTRGE